jgi:predicted dehydrogenase
MTMPNDGTNDRRLNIGIVGLGYWGPNLLRVLVDMPDVRVCRVCDLDEARLDQYARRYPTAAPSTDVNHLLSDETIDAVVIATPVFTHFDLALRSLSAGKHTFVEKPLARSCEQVDMLIEAAVENELVLMTGQTFLYSPPVRAVKGLLDRGELGDLYFISSSRVNLGLHQRDISVIWDLGPHDFTILLYWLKELPNAISAVGRDSVVPGIPDVVFINLAFPSRVLASVELSWLAPSKLRRTVLVGSEKMVVYDDGAAEPIRIFDHGVVYEDPETFGQYHLSYRTGDILAPKLSTEEPISVELATFVDAVRKGAPPEGHHELAVQVTQLLEAAESSLASGGERIIVHELAQS